MKTQLLYGFFIALANLLLQALLTLTGLHSDVSKLGTANLVGGLGAVAIGIVGTALAIRACRDAVPPERPYSYSDALTAGILVTVYANLFTVVTNLVYFTWVDPHVREVMQQAQIDKMTARGIDPDKAQHMISMFTSLPFILIAGLIGGMIFGTLISLVVAAFFRRATPAGTPVPTTI